MTPASWRTSGSTRASPPTPTGSTRTTSATVDIADSAAGDGDVSPSFGAVCRCSTTEAAATFDGVVYDGGARALHALRLTVGDDAFFEILRSGGSPSTAATSVTTEDFIALAEEVSGEDLTAVLRRRGSSRPTSPTCPD